MSKRAFGGLNCKIITKIILALFSVLLASTLLFATPILASASHVKSGFTNGQQTYVDAKLNFSLQISTGWLARPHPGNSKDTNTTVNFINPKLSGNIIEIAVMRSPTAASDFASRGTPTLSIGSYPAFNLDVPAEQQTQVACSVRLMLANNDIVTGRWCSKDATTHGQELESILATYQDQVTSTSSRVQPKAVNPVLTCADVLSNGENAGGDLPPPGDATFGAERVYPNDPAWTTSFGSGVAVCDDYSSSYGYMWEKNYLFQCVEVANRFINEEWGLQGFDVNAANYYDYYSGGSYQPGRARTLFGNQAQLSDDSSQGISAFAPVPGDLLIFQDVNNTSVGWTSGLIANDPGHVVVITNVASDHVDVVQQNWHNGEIHSFPLSKDSNGYHITDNSGWTGRVTRGWIHFSANQHTGNSTGGGSTGNSNVTKASPLVIKYSDGSQDVIAVGSDGRMWHNWNSGSGSWTGWNWWSNNTDFAPATPALVTYTDGSYDVIAVGKDGRMWHNWKGSSGNWIGWNWWSNNTDYAPVGPMVIKYSDGSQDVIAVGKDGHMWHNWNSGSGSWTGWNWWSNNTDYAAATPTLIKYSDGSYDVIAIGKDGRMWHNWKGSSGNWIGWNWWGNNTNFAAATPALVKYNDGSYDLIAVGTDGRMWHRWASASGSWIDWNWWSNSTPFALAGPLVIKYGDGSQDIIAVGKDGRMWHNWASASGSWIGWNWWSNNTVFTNATPALVRYTDGSYDAIAVGTDGRMWHKWASASGSWIDWNWWSTSTPFAS